MAGSVLAASKGRGVDRAVQPFEATRGQRCIQPDPPTPCCSWAQFSVATPRRRRWPQQRMPRARSARVRRPSSSRNRASPSVAEHVWDRSSRGLSRTGRRQRSDSQASARGRRRALLPAPIMPDQINVDAAKTLAQACGGSLRRWLRQRLWQWAGTRKQTRAGAGLMGTGVALEVMAQPALPDHAP